MREGDTGAGSAPGRLDGRGQAPGDVEAALPPAGEAALDPSAPRTGGKVTAADLTAFLASGTPSSAMTLSPAVAKMIADKGLDPNRITGTGPQGRITVEDVQNAAEGGAQIAHSLIC